MKTVNEKRVVSITGAASGIGKACAFHMAKRGVNVFAGVGTIEDGMVSFPFAGPYVAS